VLPSGLRGGLFVHLVSKELRVNKVSHSTETAVAIGAAIALVFGLSACGGESLGDDDDGKASSDVKMTEVSDEEKAKEAIESVEVNDDLKAELPDKYKNNTIEWTTAVGYPPMELFASDEETILGVDAAMAHALSRKLGLQMKITDQDFNSMIPGLVSERYDALASSMTDNEERRETTTFVDYVQSGQAFLVKGGNPLSVKDYRDVCGRTVGVVDSGSSAALLESYSAKCEEDGAKAIDILPFQSDPEANLSLKSGRADATLTDYPVAAWRDADKDFDAEMVVVQGDEAIWGIGVDNDNKELATVLQKALQELMDDGTYKEILHAWNVDDMAIDKAAINGGDE
jgi:polar amino acid transport system substrate-binding protein